MKRLLILALVFLMIVPAFAEPINSDQFVYAYIVRAIDLGAKISADDTAISSDTMFLASPMSLETKDGKVISGMFKLGKDADATNKLFSFLGAFIMPIPSLDSAQDFIFNGYMTHVGKFINVMEKATLDNPYKLCDGYDAVLFDGNVFVEYVGK